jgi:hypothetical protein
MKLKNIILWSIDNAEGHKGKECYYAIRIAIHRSVVEHITNHKGADNGKSTTKADGD